MLFIIIGIAVVVGLGVLVYKKGLVGADVVATTMSSVKSGLGYGSEEGQYEKKAKELIERKKVEAAAQAQAQDQEPKA